MLTWWKIRLLLTGTMRKSKPLTHSYMLLLYQEGARVCQEQQSTKHGDTIERNPIVVTFYHGPPKNHIQVVLWHPQRFYFQNTCRFQNKIQGLEQPDFLWRKLELHFICLRPGQTHVATPVLDYLLDATELHSSCVGRLSRSGTCRGSNPQVPNLQIKRTHLKCTVYQLEGHLSNQKQSLLFIIMEYDRFLSSMTEPLH